MKKLAKFIENKFAQAMLACGVILAMHFAGETPDMQATVAAILSAAILGHSIGRRPVPAIASEPQKQRESSRKHKPK